MLSDQVVLFPWLYQDYLQSRPTPCAAPLPTYRGVLFVGKESGDLMSSVSPHNRIGRMYHTNCDTFIMLFHVLGTSKSKHNDTGPRGLPVGKVFDELNRKV